jgi:hypothetical protein
VYILLQDPSGQSHTSANFSNGLFTYLLSKPFPIGGSIICRIPATANACLYSNGGQHSNEARVTVNVLETRVAIVEKERTTTFRDRAATFRERAATDEAGDC